MEGKIGVMDSGVGGLSVAKEIMKRMNKESLVYIGDTKRCPYGNRSIDDIRTYTFEMVDFLLQKGIKILVIACNTINAWLLEEIKKYTNIPVVGVIEQGVTLANQVTRNKKIGIIATTRTIESKRYQMLLEAKGNEVFGYDTPLLVPMIERNTYEEQEIEMLRASLFPFQRTDIDTLILGCTHYPLITDKISAAMGEGVTLVNPGVQSAIEVENILTENNQKTKKQSIEHEFYVTNGADIFQSIATSWLRIPVVAEEVGL